MQLKVESVWDALGITEEEFRSVIDESMAMVTTVETIAEVIEKIRERYDSANGDLEEKKTILAAIIFGDLHGQIRRKEEGLEEIEERSIN